MAKEKPADESRREIDRKYQRIGWAVFLLMWAATFLADRLLQADLRNFQYAAAGLILIGLNAARYLSRIPMSRLTLVIGLLAFLGGIVRQVSGDLQPIPIVLITAGALLLAQGILMMQGGRER